MVLARRRYVAAAGEPMKRMNLFTAVNDALRIAMEKDSSAVRVVEYAYAQARYQPLHEVAVASGHDYARFLTMRSPPKESLVSVFKSLTKTTHLTFPDHLRRGRGVRRGVPLHRGAA